MEYSKAVVSNAGTVAEALITKVHKLASGGTDNHLVLWVLRPHGLTGSKVEKVCEPASISLNRNTVPGDASALSPGGVRIGAPAMTTRGCITEDFKRIADFLDRSASIALDIQKEKGKNQYRHFRVPALLLSALQHVFAGFEEDSSSKVVFWIDEWARARFTFLYLCGWRLFS